MPEDAAAMLPHPLRRGAGMAAQDGKCMLSVVLVGYHPRDWL
jgi:hypothetical protein